MRAMLLEAPGRPLGMRDLALPAPGAHEVRLRVHACGVCRTDLHIADGELVAPGHPAAKLPLVLGHQIVGTVEARGTAVRGIDIGDRVGIPWLARTCGECPACRRGEENLCERAEFTGCTRDGGFAEAAVADARAAIPIPEAFSDAAAAPLLCAGLIGARALRFAGDAGRLGLYGFGAAAHILCQVAVHEGRAVHAFTRPGDAETQAFARSLGARSAQGSGEPPPEPLDAAIIFAPAGELIPIALRAVRPGGTVVCAGIHSSDIPGFPYEFLWGERTLRSVANLTRADGAFLAHAAAAGVRPEVEVFPLERANEALAAIRTGKLRGAAVLAVRG